LVANRLRDLQIDTIVPTLTDSDVVPSPYWHQHVHSVAHDLASFPTDRPLILVGHSGAGPLLPAIRQVLAQAVVAYLFVDAGLPLDGASRLDLLATESVPLATQLRQQLEAGERFPAWTDTDLRTVIPNTTQRRQILAELRPRALPFFTEHIPVFPGWPDARCAYLQFTSSYDSYVRQARHANWPVYTIEANHFHMLVAPEVVANLLVEAAETITQ
jgi:hypothetical protein